MDLTTRLSAVKNKIEEAKGLKAKAEANLEMYTRQLAELETELKAEGIESFDLLDAAITSTEAQAEAALAEAERLIGGAIIQ